MDELIDNETLQKSLAIDTNLLRRNTTDERKYNITNQKEDDLNLADIMIECQD